MSPHLKLFLTILVFICLVVFFCKPSGAAESTPGSHDNESADYWSPEHSTGVIAVAYDHKIQSFIFISIDGKRMIVSAENCGHIKVCLALVTGLMKIKHADLIDYDAPKKEPEKEGGL